MPIIVLESGEDGGKAFRFQNFILMGRGLECNVCLADTEVSERHAILVRGMDGFYLMDLGSKTGTYIGDQAISSARLDSNDVFQVGQTLIRYTVIPDHQEQGEPQTQKELTAASFSAESFEESQRNDSFAAVTTAASYEESSVEEGIEVEPVEENAYSEEEASILEEAALAGAGGGARGIKAYAMSLCTVLLWAFIGTNFFFGSYLMGQYFTQQALK